MINLIDNSSALCRVWFRSGASRIHEGSQIHNSSLVNSWCLPFLPCKFLVFMPTMEKKTGGGSTRICTMQRTRQRIICNTSMRASLYGVAFSFISLYFRGSASKGRNAKGRVTKPDFLKAAFTWIMKRLSTSVGRHTCVSHAREGLACGGEQWPF